MMFGRWQGEIEARASPFLVIRADLAAMRFNDRADNGEAHAEALFLGGHKLIEHLLADFGGNSGAAVAHAHANGAMAIWFRCDLHFPPGPSSLAHRVEGIA